MVAEERDNKIINALKEAIILNYTGIKKKTGLTDSSLGRGLKRLQQERIIILCEGLYALKENENILKEKYKCQSKQIIESFPSEQTLKEHTNELKTVIKSWLKEIPAVSSDGVREQYYPINLVLLQPFKCCSEVKLPVEVDRLFKDLEFHLDQQNSEVFQKWNKFKSMSADYNSKGKALGLLIEKELTRQANGIMPKELSNELNINCLSDNLLIFILHSCITWAEENMTNISNHKQDSVECYVINRSGGFVRVANNLLEEDFKNKLNNILNKLIAKSKIDYYHEGKELVNMMGELTKLREELKKLLNNQLSYMVFKGKCDFLKIDLSF